ncbi:hypothetical protein [Novipirellula caenicola]|uniref:T4 beta protein n=1 Tax=Novipirellula caenicola TaxID=1536901 RepID=A0ABP9VUK4_9BACT
MQLNHRLAPLHLLPPPVFTPWTGALVNSHRGSISRKQGQDIPLPLPLFWYDPPWYQITMEQADNLAVAVGELDILVTAMHRDLSAPQTESIFHAGRQIEPDDSGKSPTHRRYRRIVPYRSERYGLTVTDFDDADVVDLRLMMARDVSGRFAYSPAQIQRWEAAPATSPVAGGGWVPAATFPPDVASMEHLKSKIDQIRRLSESAAVFVSMGPFRMGDELPKLLAAEPDGLILRLDEIQLEGLELAAITRRARQMMNAEKCSDMPLWVVPGTITPDDAVKLVALGASAVAIDDWCNNLIMQTRDSQPATTAAATSGAAHQYDPRWGDFVKDHLGELTDRFLGLFESLQSVSENERLGSFSGTWANVLGVQGLR